MTVIRKSVRLANFYSHLQFFGEEGGKSNLSSRVIQFNDIY